MKKTLIALFLLSAVAVMAQKPRPDAFPPVPDTLSPKAITMATTLEEMDTWDKYPTYEVYMAMMQRFVDSFPDLCHVDTIGTSVQGRLILSLAITGSDLNDMYRPEFFYSSTMHGDEVTAPRRKSPVFLTAHVSVSTPSLTPTAPIAEATIP